MKRRKLLQLGATTFAAFNIPDIVSAALRENLPGNNELPDNSVILFQGDSITDFGRDRNPPKYNLSNADRSSEYNDFNALGCGYAMLAATQMLYNNPRKKLKIFNRGISGNKVYQLAERWQEDCIAIKPTLLSILIGVNDYWHTLSNAYTGTAETYRNDYKKLLDSTVQKLPGLQLIIGEPFALKGVGAVTDKWYPAFDEYRAIAKEIAGEYKAVFIPYQRIFEEALSRAPASYWTFDGVHPSIPGSMLMAEAWLSSVKTIK